MDFLDFLAQTALIEWVVSSEFGYPIVLTFHAIGMGLVVGLMLILDIRVLGFARSINLQGLTKFFRLAWIGFGINLVSGTLIFLGDAGGYLGNTAFLVKIGLLVTGGILAFTLVKGLRENGLLADNSTQTFIPVALPCRNRPMEQRQLAWHRRTRRLLAFPCS